MTAPAVNPGAVAPHAGGVLRAAARVMEHWAFRYRRTWKGTVSTAVISPVLFLAAMGVGLGSLVDRGVGDASLDGMDYLDFVGPGLLAAFAMQAAVIEGAWPVLGGFKWDQIFHAMVASPLSPGAIVIGHLAFVALRLLFNGLVFGAVLLAFGVGSAGGLALAALVAMVCGLAFTAPMTAYSATIEHEAAFSVIFRFVVTPLFLFSGAFFPVSQLPDLIEPLAYVTPTWHGVAAARDLALGQAAAASTLGHVAYLALWVVGGAVAARRSFARRLHR